MEKNIFLKALPYWVGIIIVAVLGSIFVNIGMDWFDLLEKPSQWVSNFIIPLVWSVIYIAFAIIIFLWLKNDNISKKINILLIINGALNIVWCLIYFSFNSLFIGNIFIILNLIASIILWIEIFNVKNLYGYILCIYPLWLCIATTLNLATWILN